jgi:hypothetical protein
MSTLLPPILPDVDQGQETESEVGELVAVIEEEQDDEDRPDQRS